MYNGNMASQQQIPIILLKEGTTETKKRDAQKNNISAAKLVADIVKTSLGPRGMDKMLVDGLGDVTITNDGATILKEMDIEHPVAKMLVEISKSVDNEVGDGTTSVVVLAGSLLEKSEELVEKNVHPTIIVDGYKQASKKALEILKQIAIKIDPKDANQLKKIATTSMNSKITSSNTDILSKIIVDSVLSVAQELENRKFKVDIDDIKVEKKTGGSTDDTTLVTGIILDKEVVHGGMPKRINGAKIALINSPLEIEKTEFDAKIDINSPDQMKKFLDEENNILKDMVNKIKETGVNVLLCQKGIDDIAQHYLAREEILAVRRIKESDMSKLSKATGAILVNNINELSESDLGKANLVEERKIETDKWVFIEGCKNPKSLTIFIRGGSQRVIDEVERSIHDAIMTVKDVVEYPYIVLGGGAPEARISQELREWSNTLTGRTQLAVEKFADSIETIPLVLAENSGMDLIDAQTELRSKNVKIKAKYGIDVINGKITDLSQQNIYEPLSVKEQVINAAAEVSCMILRVDDIIASSKSAGGPSLPGGGMGGGMPGM